MIPGVNILQMALGLVTPQSAQWSRYQGVTQNAAGFDVPTWADPIPILGSFQPASNSMLQQLGLDWSKNYASFYASGEFVEPSRDKTGDRLAYDGRVYQVETRALWFAQDGWEGVLCVQVTNA